jgi:hypothetical protein
MAYARGLPTPLREPRRGSRFVIVDAMFIVVAFLFLGYSLFIAQFSPTVRWGLGILAIGAVGAAAWWAVNRRTETPDSLDAPLGISGSRAGELSALTQTVRRASRGLPFSQLLVTERLREAFMAHARLALGLTPEAMRRLAADPAALRRAFRDVSIADFLYLSSADPEERYRWIAEARRGPGFDASISAVLDRMEAWR